jgi:hypothetical protein
MPVNALPIPSRSFLPPRGWQGHCELETQCWPS